MGVMGVGFGPVGMGRRVVEAIHWEAPGGAHREEDGIRGEELGREAHGEEDAAEPLAASGATGFGAETPVWSWMLSGKAGAGWATG